MTVTSVPKMLRGAVATGDQLMKTKVPIATLALYAANALAGAE
jgi:hypothetical protein